MLTASVDTTTSYYPNFINIKRSYTICPHLCVFALTRQDYMPSRFPTVTQGPHVGNHGSENPPQSSSNTHLTQYTSGNTKIWRLLRNIFPRAGSLHHEPLSFLFPQNIHVTAVISSTNDIIIYFPIQNPWPLEQATEIQLCEESIHAAYCPAKHSLPDMTICMMYHTCIAVSTF